MGFTFRIRVFVHNKVDKREALTAHTKAILFYLASTIGNVDMEL